MAKIVVDSDIVLEKILEIRGTLEENPRETMKQIDNFIEFIASSELFEQKNMPTIRIR